MMVFMTARRLAVLASLAVAVTVPGCKPRHDPPSPSPSVTASAVHNRDRLETACGVERSVQPKYVVRGQEHVDFADVPRLKVLVSVPPGLSREELDTQMRHAVLVAYDSGGASSLGALNVFAWGSEKTEGSYTAARAVFAPEGDWAKADPSVFLEKWAVKVEFAPGYFGAKPVALAPGTNVVLEHKDGPRTVLVSKSATSWGDADTLTRAAIGTKARVLNVRELNAGEGRTMLRYEVELATTKQRGWVHSYDLRAP